MNITLILIGGIPGSGKTYIGKEIARSIGVFVDKDTITRFFTERLLELLGAPADDRESDTYLKKVRDIEYQTMMKHALENIELGRSVICSAPFIREFADGRWLDEITLEAELLDARVITVWIHVDPATARERIAARGATRDTWKLANWDQFLKTLPQTTPPTPTSLILDNSGTPSTPIMKQVEALVARLKGDRI